MKWRNSSRESTVVWLGPTDDRQDTHPIPKKVAASYLPFARPLHTRDADAGSHIMSSSGRWVLLNSCHIAAQYKCTTGTSMGYGLSSPIPSRYRHQAVFSLHKAIDIQMHIQMHMYVDISDVKRSSYLTAMAGCNTCHYNRVLHNISVKGRIERFQLKFPMLLRVRVLLSTIVHRFTDSTVRTLSPKV